MAQANATNLSDFSGYLRPDQAQNYFDIARRSSIVQQLARQIPMGINGQEFSYSTSKATAAWTSEAGQKPTTESGIALKSIKPHKIAAISVVSAEVVRANPGNYMQVLRDDIAEAFAVAFDAAALHGTNSPFGAGQNLDATTKAVELGTTAAASGGVYGDLVAGLKELADDGKRLTGFAFDRKVEPTFLGAVDTTGRPLFVETPLAETTSAVTPGRLLGRSSVLGEGIATPVVEGSPNTGGIVGYGGDWSKVVWGAVGGISYDVSTETAVTIGSALVSLWEHNLVAIRAEAEYGFMIDDAEAFVKFTDNS